MILFKRDKYRLEFKKSPIILRQMVFDFDLLASKMGIDLTITRVKEKVKGESGVHNDNRAIDIRDEFKGKSTYNMDQRLAIFHFLNAVYPRNDSYLSCIIHDFNSGPTHWHLQIPYKWYKLESLKVPNK